MQGTRLGPYEILERLGAGGMGEVWLAQDTRLGRKVAVKVLPAEFAADPQRLARFEQEARAAAALNHPHIAAVFDVGHANDTHFMVQEYLQGEVLRGALQGGALPLRKALALGIEIAAALRAAHEAGIVHRDIKPENVFVTREGHAKVLDFGLAKLTESSPLGSGSMSPTVLGTVAGQLMGTAGYMAPEQVEGVRDIDHRADLFAFGAVLYEMVAGSRAFAGRSVADTLARIQHEEPTSLGKLDAALPAELQRIVGKALAKDPGERYQHAADLLVDLRALARAVDTGTAAPIAAPAAAPSLGAPRAASPWVLLGVAAASAALNGLIVWSLLRDAPVLPRSEVSFDIDLPADVVELPRGSGGNIDIASDGMTVVFVGMRADGSRGLYARRLDESSAALLPGTAFSYNPKYSHDGAWLAFGVGETRFSRMKAEGGEPFSFCDNCLDASWDDQGNLYYSGGGSLWRQASDGTRELVSEPVPEQDVYFGRPEPLPGGQAVLFEFGQFEFGGIGVWSIPDRRVIRLTSDGSDPFYAPTGHVLYPRGSTLFALPFDVRSLRATGAAEPVLQAVRVENAGALQADIADNGTLAYLPVGNAQRSQLAWARDDGEVVVATAERRNYSTPRISPDGQRAVVIVNEEGKTDLWIAERTTGALRQLTSRGDATSPRWTPDGGQVAFAGSTDDGGFAIYLIDVETRATRELYRQRTVMRPSAFTPAGNRLVFADRGPGEDLFVLDLDAGSVEAVVTATGRDAAAALSADGTLLAYDSNRMGEEEVFVRELATGREIQVSTDGGSEPVWGRSEYELHFRQTKINQIVTVTVAATPRLAASGPRPRFNAAPFWVGIDEAAYDVGPDGEFLLVRQRDPGDPADRVRVILNFDERLKRLAPAAR